MRTQNTILCPIDFSESSLEALEYAVEIAGKEDMAVVALYSYRLIQTEQGEEILEFKNKAEAAAKEKFSRLEHYFDFRGVEHEFVIEIGFLSDCIARQIRTKPVVKVVIDGRMRQTLTEGYPGREPLLHGFAVPVVVIGGHGQTA